MFCFLLENLENEINKIQCRGVRVNKLHVPFYTIFVINRREYDIVANPFQYHNIVIMLGRSVKNTNFIAFQTSAVTDLSFHFFNPELQNVPK